MLRLLQGSERHCRRSGLAWAARSGVIQAGSEPQAGKRLREEGSHPVATYKTLSQVRACPTPSGVVSGPQSWSAPGVEE
jgi:hypothetical protein